MPLAAVLPSGKDVTAYSLLRPLQPGGQTDLEEDSVGVRARSALKKAVAETKDSEDCLQTILDTIPAQAWCLYADGRVAYLNQRWHEYAGLSREEVYGRWKGEPGRAATGIDLSEVVNHPDDAPSAAKWRQKILSAAKPGQFEVRLRRY